MAWPRAILSDLDEPLIGNNILSQKKKEKFLLNKKIMLVDYVADMENEKYTQANTPCISDKWKNTCDKVPSLPT